MSKAFCLLRDALHYRRESFIAGLQAAGYTFNSDREPYHALPGDVLVTWNRFGQFEMIADRFEKQGGTVVVAENGYMGRDTKGNKMYALSTHGHNGSGHWNYRGPERLAALGIELKPWRVEGRHVLICPNRSFGMRGFKMPNDFGVWAMKEIRKFTERPVKIRPHPGNTATLITEGLGSLEHDLKNAWAVVIWSSSAGIKALVAGIPVIRAAPFWIAAGAEGGNFCDIEDLKKPDRLPVLQSVAWAQWSLEEIRCGEAFRVLLGEKK